MTDFKKFGGDGGGGCEAFKTFFILLLCGHHSNYHLHGGS